MQSILAEKITHDDYRRMIAAYAAGFSEAENELLREILNAYCFDPVQQQALVQAVMQQSRFDPNAGHLDGFDDEEEGTSVCPHCINPPAPPLRDYLMWRQKS